MPQTRRKAPGATKNVSTGKWLAIAAAGTLAVLCIGGGFLWFNSSDSNDSSTLAEIDPSAKAANDGDGSQRPDTETAESKGGSPTRATPQALKPLDPQEIVDTWFDIREKSEEGQRPFVFKKGSAEYEARIERYLSGERRSRELLRSALASSEGDEALRTEMAQRNRKFFDSYLFGTSPDQWGDGENVLQKDPRLQDRKWKTLLAEFMRSGFFPLSKTTQMKGSKEFLVFVQTLEQFAKRFNEYVAMGQPKGVRNELDSLSDRMIDLAIDAYSINGPYSVPRDHQIASNVYVKFTKALMRENGIDAASSAAEASLLDQFSFAATQFDSPVTRNAESMRRQWAEVKDPQLRMDRLHAEELAAEKRKAESEAARMASLEANRKASEERSNQRVQDAMQGRSSRMPAGLQDRLGSRRGVRNGTSGPTGGPRFGSKGPPNGSQGHTDGVILTIEGSRETEELVNAFAAKVKAQIYIHRRNRSTTTVALQWTKTMQELADQIDFGEVVEVDEPRKRLKIQM